MHRASKFALPFVILIVLAIELTGSAGELEYRRALFASEPWRLVTGHFAHLSLLHAMLNGVALLLIGRLFAGRLRLSEMLAILVVSSLLISLAFRVVLPELLWYRGLSGALHALFFAGCVAWLATTRGRARWLPVAALAAGALKVLLEQPWDSSFPIREWLGAAVVPQAHLIGAVIGVAAGLVLARRRRQEQRAIERQRESRALA